MYDKNPELDRDVVEAVLKVLDKNNSHITYGYLAELIAQKRGADMSAQAFSYALGRIQDYCVELGLPALSVMVVNKTDTIPNEGFIGYYRDKHPEQADLMDEEIIEMEQQKCLACNDWQKLLDFVGAN